MIGQCEKNELCYRPDGHKGDCMGASGRMLTNNEPRTEQPQPTTAPVDRHRKLANEIIHGPLNGKRWKDRIIELLAGFARQVRLEEAEWWSNNGGNIDQQACRERLAALRSVKADGIEHAIGTAKRYAKTPKEFFHD